MTELTAEMIVDFAVPQELDISPDGTRVAYALAPNSKKEEHATSSLRVATTNGSRAARQFTRGDVEDHLTSSIVTSNGAFWYYLRPTGSLHLVGPRWLGT